jgi:cell division protein FtsQ
VWSNTWVMDSSLPGRAALGRRARPGRPPSLRGARAPLGLRGRGRLVGVDRGRWRRPGSAVARPARAAWLSVWGRRRLRIALLIAVVALPSLAGAWLWLRDSPLVAVERVQISGVHGPEAQAIDAALGRAARRMSTLDVRPGALLAAVASYRVVREVRAIPSFPHGLRIRVAEQLPVAALTVAGARTAVAADGVLLGPALLSGSLPVVAGAGESSGAAGGRLTGQHVRGAWLRASLSVLGAAPAPLARAAVRVFTGSKGVTVAMRSGLHVYFGDASRPHAKWLSLARVLADPSSAGATYVDVRLPERPAAGFAGAVAPEANAAGVEPSSASEPTTSAELAAGLATALGGSATGASPSSGATPAESTPGPPAQAAPGTATEATEAPSAPAPSAPAPEAPEATPAPGG